MNLHSVVAEFAALPHAKIGRGPRHPSRPNVALTLTIEEFLRRHPQLRLDPEYVEFLECYAGASVHNPDLDNVIDILGFTDVSSDYNDLDGPEVDEEGYLLFCTTIYHEGDVTHPLEFIEADFAHDDTGTRRPGVYVAVSSAEQSAPYQWFSESFVTWLDQLIRNRGRLP